MSSCKKKFEIYKYLIGFAEKEFLFLNVIEITKIRKYSRVKIVDKMGDKTYEYSMNYLDFVEKVERSQIQRMISLQPCC